MSIHAPSRRQPATRVDRIPWGDLAGVRVGVVLWGGLALVDVGRLAHAPSYVELGAVALLVTAASVGVRTHVAAASALVGWLVVDGFVDHRYGVLGWDGLHDVLRLALVLTLALAATWAHR